LGLSRAQYTHVFLLHIGAIANWRALIGPTDSNKARAEAPQSLRAQFGTDGSQNACHGSDAPETAAAELSFFFEQPRVGKCDLGSNTTLCLVKPHAVKSGLAGRIITKIQQVGFAQLGIRSNLEIVARMFGRLIIIQILLTSIAVCDCSVLYS